MLRLPRRSTAILALTAALSAGLSAGCSSTGHPSASAGSTIAIVSSTNVWGELAAEVGGTRVTVTSFISNPNADPHSYEASTQNLLAMSKAHVVIENGGGYDDFMDTMRKAAHNSSATVINAVDVSGKQAQQGADLNEHVWYDFSTVTAVVERIRSALARALPAGAPTFAVNATALTGRIAAMQHTEAAIKAGNAGRGVAITEPVPLYLLQACGLVNRTPPAFSKAVEEESDVSPRVLSDTLALFDARQVALLAYNSQTTSATTDRVIAAAKARAVPTVPVTETLPAGKTYVAWMTDTLTAVRSALSS